MRLLPPLISSSQVSSLHLISNVRNFTVICATRTGRKNRGYGVAAGQKHQGLEPLAPIYTIRLQPGPFRLLRPAEPAST